jgi:hypothetical protein
LIVELPCPFRGGEFLPLDHLQVPFFLAQFVLRQGELGTGEGIVLAVAVGTERKCPA